MKMPLIQNFNLSNKKVLVRVDFNVPLNKDNTIADPSRIVESLPTINFILENGGIPILMSHFGRPDGKANPLLSLEPCANYLMGILKNNHVYFSQSCCDDATARLVSALKTGDILLLENLRFHRGEEHPEQDPTFAQKLASFADLYVNDAFGTAHREHSSTFTIVKYFKGRSAAGFLLQKEVTVLNQILKNPFPPFYAIIGGAKISSKLGILKSLASKCQGIFIGGGMCFNFMKAFGYEIGSSIWEPDLIEETKEFLKECRSKDTLLFFPKDILIANSITKEAKTKIISFNSNIPEGYSGVDVGPATIENWSVHLNNAKTIFWNGPLGICEIPSFSNGSHSLAKYLSKLSNATTIVGGGESVAIIHNLHLENKFSHISTGGGASLEFIEQGSLPGINALIESN